MVVSLIYLLYMIFFYISIKTNLCTSCLMISFLDSYALNMNDAWRDNMVAESSAMGAANNGGMPPHDHLHPVATTNEQENQNSSNNRGRGNHNLARRDVIRTNDFPTGRFDEDGKEYCPVTKKEITPQGRCQDHYSSPCEGTAESSAASAMERRQKLEGYYDPVRDLWKPLTKRHEHMNINREYQSSYGRWWRSGIHSYALRQRYTWLMAEEARGRTNIKIGDLGLESTVKHYLRYCITRDSRVSDATREIFLNRNIDHYPVDRFVKDYLSLFRRRRPIP